MKELDKLKLHLDNLKKEGHQEFTINVNYLLNILENISKQSPSPKESKTGYIDGGNFADE
tara:strand:- start:295 stop:474 length:180 start_codon:yes stop_codon:yes gene_type:complete